MITDHKRIGFIENHDVDESHSHGMGQPVAYDTTKRDQSLDEI